MVVGRHWRPDTHRVRSSQQDDVHHPFTWPPTFTPVLVPCPPRIKRMPCLSTRRNLNAFDIACGAVKENGPACYSYSVLRTMWFSEERCMNLAKRQGIMTL